MARSKILIARIGKDANDPFVQLAQDYLVRLRGIWHPQVVSTQGNLLTVTQGYFRVCLDERGNALTSVQLAKKLTEWIEKKEGVAFLIGGAAGFLDSEPSSCDYTWSLSPLTLPHKMAFCLLTEQLYRAHTIIKGTPYHK